MSIGESVLGRVLVVASRACGSMSKAVPRPRHRSAARPRIPEPQPSSRGRARRLGSRRRAIPGTAPSVWSACRCQRRAGDRARAPAASGSPARLAGGQTQSRRPNRIGRKSFSHSRSQIRSSTRSATTRPGASRGGTASSVAASSAGFAARSNKARRRTSCQSGVSPGAGSSSGSSPASASHSAIAPSCAAGVLGARQIAARELDDELVEWHRRTRPGLLEPESALEVVDVRAAVAEGRVLKISWCSGDVGLDAFDHHLGQRVAHARDRRVAGLAVGRSAWRSASRRRAARCSRCTGGCPRARPGRPAGARGRTVPRATARRSSGPRR